MTVNVRPVEGLKPFPPQDPFSLFMSQNTIMPAMGLPLRSPGHLSQIAFGLFKVSTTRAATEPFLVR